MKYVTPGALSTLLFALPACGTAVEQEPVPPSDPGAAISLAPERSAPPVYYDSQTSIDPIVARRMNMRMTTRNAVSRDQATFSEPTLIDACGWKTPTVYFPSGGSELAYASQPTVDSIAACLRSEPLAEEPIILVGHADDRSSSYDNLELGLQRANEVKQELVESGIPAERIETYSRGDYLADQDEQSQDDRRVVVKLDR